MAKSRLTSELSALESDLITTLLAGHKEWRPDLSYPESHSDMQGAVRAVLMKYVVTLRPVPMRLRYECYRCGGLGEFRSYPEPTHLITLPCPDCKGKGYTE